MGSWAKVLSPFGYGVAVSSMNTFVVEDESADYLIEDA